MPLIGILEKLYTRRRFGIRPGIDRIKILLDRLGNPERSFASIHVVGTNGKGSTSAFLSSILTNSGYQTALFTSPHLVNFNERFRIDGTEIDSNKLAILLERVLAIAPEESTFFEIVTALGALCFAEEHIEIAVMEAGMGGCSDATAAFPGILTLIAPISLDHCDYLGTTIEEITREKSAIAEPSTPVLSAQQPEQVQSIIANNCLSAGSPFYVAETDFTARWNSHGLLDYNGMNIKLADLETGIAGRYQSGNAALALAAAETLLNLGMKISPEAMRSGLANAHWPGRMEMIPGQPRLLLDGAHNPAGAAALAESLGSYSYKRILLVTGIMADKDAKAILAPLAEIVSKAFCVAPDIDRAMDDKTLAKITTELCIESVPCGSIANGITIAKNEAEADDLILVCGSLFTVGEAKAWLAGKQFKGIRG